MTSSVSGYSSDPELGGFDCKAREIIGRALDAGWTARRSNRGHMLLRAPDGVTTTSISRDMSAPRVRKNAVQPIRAWERMADDGACAA